MTDNQILRYMHTMKDLASKCNLLQRHVAMAIKNGKIISKPQINDFRPYVFSQFMGTIHAELHAIRSVLGKNEYCILQPCKKRKEE
jgi:hypothetical protein